MPRIEKDLVIKSPKGLHARPAALFVQIVEKYKSEVTLQKDDLKVNGNSIMGLLMLGAEHQSTIKVVADGEDAEELINTLEEFLDSDE